MQTLHAERIALTRDPDALARVIAAALESPHSSDFTVTCPQSIRQPLVCRRPRRPLCSSAFRFERGAGLGEPRAREPCKRGEPYPILEHRGRDDRCWIVARAASRNAPRLAGRAADLLGDDVGLTRGVRRAAHRNPKTRSRKAVHGPAVLAGVSSLSTVGAAAAAEASRASSPSRTTTTFSPFFTIPS